VVVHQAIGCTAPSLLEDFFTQEIQKSHPVLIVLKYIRAGVSAGRYVVQRAWKF